MGPSIGQKLTLTIDDIAFGGEGVARSDAFVIFVPFVVPGEIVGPQLVPEQFRDERLVPVTFEVHADRRKGLPDYRTALGLN